ncbi:ion transporter [Erwinia rhapontici]|nr:MULTISPECIES: ion transporter [Erwinia]MBP2156105.1 voltage-gated potassium channel [Erwinia rhapontici]NKG30178.1 ion transporter [Erwinia rhapontici]NNS05473.1 ion transporter [Erwinia sp. JH02]TDT02353.1 voltage-gated potassium channel [Erwinia rhapontici]UDQ78371.1 ion transporter [Erwinia rhapontici]
MAKQDRSWRQRLYIFLFDVSSPAGRRFEIFWVITTLVSVMTLFIESAEPHKITLQLKEASVFLLLEYAFTLLFSLEYVLRLLTTERPMRYVFSFFGIVDLITTLPLYIFWLWPDIALRYMMAIRLLRVLRLLRLIKLLRYMGSANVLWDSLVSARKKLSLFFGGVMILLCVFGGLMYVIEGPENGFTSLPVAVYWAVVTMTTVGYGDITPHTPLGRMISSILILLGYSLIAIPTGVMSSYMTEVMQRNRHRRHCTVCKQTGHEDDAHFCKGCGGRLGDKNKEGPD